MALSNIEPPWVVFPDYDPDAPFWRQTGDAYLSGFLSLWRDVSDGSKWEYLEQWNAPPAWRDHLKPGGFWDWLRSVDN